MSNVVSTSGKHWAVILAGGEGQRVRPLVQRWLGRHVPKQYCTFVGTRSMFQHTLCRARMLTDPEHILTVIAPGHRQEALAQCEERASGRILVQPRNRDTAAGIFLPLAWIRSRDPDATVVIYPSDHFIYPEERFVAVVEQALGAAEEHPDRLVLLGVRPDHLEPEYGWILTGETLDEIGPAIRTVRAFIEKPGREQASYAMASGALWNTFVIIVRLRTVWTLGHQCFPELMPWFERLSERHDAVTDVEFLEAVYRDMPARNFSFGLLQRIPDQTAVIELADVLWCDWGKPERIVETLRKIGKQPAFPEEFLAGPQIRAPAARTDDPVLATARPGGHGR